MRQRVRKRVLRLKAHIRNLESEGASEDRTAPFRKELSELITGARRNEKAGVSVSVKRMGK